MHGKTGQVIHVKERAIPGFDDDDLQPAGVAGRHYAAHLFGHLRVAVQQAEAPGLPNGHVVLRQVGRPGAIVGVHGIGELQALQPVFGVGECRHQLAVFQRGVAAAVIGVQMRIDHDIHVLRLYIVFG